MTDKPKSLIPYDSMVMNALRSVVRESVQLVSDEGLPGEHHFFLTYRTDHPDAQLPKAILAKYPTEIRIVLQNQFSNLYVDDFGFHVTLFFGGVPAPLYVPFEAITSFHDPHVQFSMRFDPMGLTDSVEESENTRKSAQAEVDNVVNLSSFRKS